jgi:hypothetical protein
MEKILLKIAHFFTRTSYFVTSYILISMQVNYLLLARQLKECSHCNMIHSNLVYMLLLLWLYISLNKYVKCICWVCPETG